MDKSAVFEYEWSSNCVGNCFVRGETDATVSTDYLHSYDSGVHTCTVYDLLGCVGSANITVNVVGKENLLTTVVIFTDGIQND